MRPETSKCHRHLIRTGLSARVTYFIGVAGMATAAGRVGVETVVLGRGDDPAVAVNIDIARSRPVPGEIHYVPTLYCSHTH